MRPILFLLATAGCSVGGAADAPAPPPVVRVVAAEPEAAPARRLTGEVRARIESDLGFRVPGMIATRLVDPGERVRAGQPLMRLDPADLALAATAAAAQVAVAEATAARANADLRRLDGLVTQGAISAQSFDAARTGAEAARAQVAAARAAARQAANARGYGVLRADADGVVVAVLAQPGQVMEAGKPVVRLGRAGEREALVAVPETLRASLPATADARVVGSDRTYTATLREVSGAADPATRTFAARYRLAGGDALPLGATVMVDLPLDTAPALSVPLGALRDTGRGPSVFVVNQGRVRLRPVRVAGYGDDTARIASGLRPGEPVVAFGASLLSDGQPVRVAR